MDGKPPPHQAGRAGFFSAAEWGEKRDLVISKIGVFIAGGLILRHRLKHHQDIDHRRKKE